MHTNNSLPDVLFAEESWFVHVRAVESGPPRIPQLQGHVVPQNAANWAGTRLINLSIVYIDYIVVPILNLARG